MRHLTAVACAIYVVIAIAVPVVHAVPRKPQSGAKVTEIFRMVRSSPRATARAADDFGERTAMTGFVVRVSCVPENLGKWTWQSTRVTLFTGKRRLATFKRLAHLNEPKANHAKAQCADYEDPRSGKLVGHWLLFHDGYWYRHRRAYKAALRHPIRVVTTTSMVAGHDAAVLRTTSVMRARRAAQFCGTYGSSRSGRTPGLFMEFVQTRFDRCSGFLRPTSAYGSPKPATVNLTISFQRTVASPEAKVYDETRGPPYEWPDSPTLDFPTRSRLSWTATYPDGRVETAAITFPRPCVRDCR